jgi:hypothetical protein
MKLKLYWDWLRDEAARINSDGCTVVSECYHECCLEHDLSYYHGKSPRSAYSRYLEGYKPWKHADPITRKQSDSRFRECIRAKSPLGKWSPMAFVRWCGVRAFGWLYWNHEV